MYLKRILAGVFNRARTPASIGISAIVLTLSVAPSTIVAQQNEGDDPVTAPFLQFNLDMHTSRIRRIAVNVTGDTMISISPDRSIRAWDLVDGALLRTIRVPLGEKHIGDPIALDVSSSGKTIFVVSQSFDERGGVHDYSIYGVRRETGTIFGRVRLGLNTAPRAIDYAPGNNFMAIALGPQGIKVLKGNLQEFETPAADAEEGHSFEWVSFGPDGEMVVLTDTGQVRLYQMSADDGLELVDVLIGESATEPARAVFSSDGQYLAVGYFNSRFVDVYDVRDRRLIYSLDAPDASDGNLAIVTWAKDAEGQEWLVAGGTVQDTDRRNILAFWNDFNAEPVMLPVAEDSITGLAPALDGSVVYSTGRPELGRVSLPTSGEAPELIFARDGENLDMRAAGDGGLALSRDGKRVAVRTRGDATIAFDLETLRLSSRRPPGLRKARENSADLTFQNWQVGATPRISGFPLVATSGLSLLEDGEFSLSVDLPPGDDIGVVGADFHIFLVDSEGYEVSRVRVPAPAWGVVASMEAGVVVAALGDGTLRWYAIDRNYALSEQVAVFIHADQERWAAWRSDGYFAHSDFGGADLIGYHLNGTRDSLTGQSVQFDELYDVLYRPGRVRDALDEPSEIRDGPDPERFARLIDRPMVSAVRWCAQKWANVRKLTRSLDEDDAIDDPEVRATCREVDTVTTAQTRADDGGKGADLPPGFDAVTLTVNLVAGQGGITRIEALSDGRLVGNFELNRAQRRQAQEDGLQVQIDVPIYAGDVATIRLRAYNDAGVFRLSDTLFFRSTPGPATGSETEEDPSTLFVLAIGVDNYNQGRTGIRDLSFAVKDASAVAREVSGKSRRGYDAVAEPVVLSDNDATRESILAAIAEIAQRADQNDAVVIYLAGHGVARPDGFFFLGADMPGPTDADVDTYGISGSDMGNALAGIVSGNLLIILDTCYAGVFDVFGPDQLSNRTGRLVMTSTADDEEALDHAPGTGHGVFAAAMLEGLSGRAAIEGIVDALSLGSFLIRRVQELATTLDHSQAAMVKAGGGAITNFPLSYTAD